MKRAVVTAIFGEYEALVEQPVAAESACDFICFTDDSELTSSTWNLVAVTPAIPGDAARSVRQVKIVGHPRLSQYSETLWIDNRVVLRRRPEELLESWLEGFDLAMIRHSHRASVLDEYRAVLRKRLDSPARVREQLAMMRQFGPSVLEEVPYWGALIARRHTLPVAEFAQTWMNSVLRFSRRDQLSVNEAIARCKLAVNGVELDNFASEWHMWLSTAELPKDRRARYTSGFEYGLGAHILDAVKTSRLVRHLRWRILAD